MSAEPGKTDVVVLCGGLGTRLRRAVPDLPKPMAEVGGSPFLALLLDYIAGFGFRRFILCVGYKAGDVEAYFAKNKAGYDAVISREDRPLGTGGAIANAAGLLESDPFMAVNGDSLCVMDYGAILGEHVASGSAATMAIVNMKLNGEVGEVAIAGDGRAAAFREKTVADREGAVNAGVYVFDRGLLREWPAVRPLSLEKDVFPRLAAERRLQAFRAHGSMLDIGTPERYEIARRKLAEMIGKPGRRD